LGRVEMSQPDGSLALSAELMTKLDVDSSFVLRPGQVHASTFARKVVLNPLPAPASDLFWVLCCSVLGISLATAHGK
jgi:hypothetical protein